jgi:uncharacterized protein
MKVAIVGGGISGLIAGYELNEKGIDFTLFEACDQFGGHSKTVKVPLDGNDTIPVELGTIMYDPKLMHPVMHEYVKKTGVKFEEFPLTFTHHDAINNFTWSTQSHLNGSLRKLDIGIKTLGKGVMNGNFKQSASFLFELERFLRSIKSFKRNKHTEHMSVGKFLHAEQFSSDLRDNWLIPQLLCWWGVPKQQALETSIQVFADSINKVVDTPQYMFSDGWTSFIEKIGANFNKKIKLNSPARKIYRHLDHIQIATDNGVERFDKVLLAVPPNISIQLLQDKTHEEDLILKSYSTTTTTVYLHTDASWIPLEKDWSILNLINKENETNCTFWVGGVHPKKPHLFLTWGDGINSPPDPQKTLLTSKWLRTLPTVGYTYACKDINKLQGANRTWYCGAHVHALGVLPPSLWHENALRSGIQAARSIGEERCTIKSTTSF